ncbi:DoxX family protein [Paenibacillus sp. P26]|nr:DoxX family protein [Paenibacillus sp. P26]UUZ97745.1 DoxX family protein [Paenibacillus sp. P25]
MEVIILSLMAGMFIFSSASKLLRTQAMVRHWNDYRYPMRFMTVIAVLELAGAVGLLLSLWIPPVQTYAAILLAALMLGAIHAHLVRAGHHPLMAINAFFMLVLAVFLIWR